ncbi:MAG: dipeptide ABC transporter ATP-binding protein [Anaerolineaceae bacterium]|nr:dipeptide ABC transporter ATP-binding protein [Anaerolineaceae bacterium]
MDITTTQAASSRETLIEVKNLVKYYPVHGGILNRMVANVKAVDGISFSIKEGETLSLVGESGCGKTTAGQTLLRLYEPTSGEVYYKGRNLANMKGSEIKAFRRDLQIVFQDPYGSLDPRLPIGESIAEGLKIHKIGTAQERFEMVLKAMSRVGLQDFHALRYPHEFSGGQRQRIGIARALVMEPKFVVLDEPVSALDVSIQAQVLNILKDLQDDLHLTYLFVAHNLGVVEHISDRVAVMYLGKIVELSTRETVFNAASHPYTVALLSAVPNPDPNARRERILLKGDVPSALNPPSGCRFHPRCSYADKQCSMVEPELNEVAPGHFVACHHPRL